MQLSHSLQAQGGKGLQADRPSCLPLFWTWKAADRWISWVLKDLSYRRSKSMGKTGESLILGRWGNLKPDLPCVPCYAIIRESLATANCPVLTAFPTIPIAPECPQQKGSSAQKDLGCRLSMCCPETCRLGSAPPGYFLASFQAAARSLIFIIWKNLKAKSPWKASTTRETMSVGNAGQ